MYITIYMLNRCTDFNEIRLGDTLIFEDMSYSDNWLYMMVEPRAKASL